MHAARSCIAALTALLALSSMGQVTFPDCYIQNVNWTEGAHHIVMPQAIYSPGDDGEPASTTAAANTEFVSGTQVRLMPGFHAGDLTSEGRFRAYINTEVGSPNDLVVISTTPTTEVVDNVVHVKKWEKFELGYKLPQEYQDAIEHFFDAYYPGRNNLPVPDYTAHPTAPDELHDLNPYADDSLQLVMTLIDPSGDARMKWGFYMKEGGWTSEADDGNLAPADPAANTLIPFNVRFRFAPDEEGAWQFSLSIKAPHTLTAANAPMPEVFHSGYGFVCDPPLPDNHGPLSVNEVNRRVLEFKGDETMEDDDSPFMGLGVNMADVHCKFWPNAPEHNGGRIYKRDFEIMKTSMTQLHTVGGNFLRMYSMRNIFAPEWVNLGVYDAFKTPQVCDMGFNSPLACDNGGWQTDLAGNCQYQAWAFDQMLDHARANNIYIQLCIDPYPPVIEYERFLWGAHPYVIHFLEPKRKTTGNPLDIKRFFYSFEDPDDTESARLYEEGAFYYWKRKYKYIMSRWGYSVNLPIIEPFNEIDQMLTYVDKNMVHTGAEGQPTDPCKFFGGVCLENRVDWDADPLLRSTISDWFSDITDFVRGEPNWNDPVHSPLGESKKLFLASYAGGSATEAGASSYYIPFLNPDVDLIDAHKGMHNPWDMQGFSANVEDYRSTFTSGGVKKPFNSGEFTHYVKRMLGEEEYDLTPFFHNYEIAFHNELWASAFSGRFSAGCTWAWPRVFWWAYAQDTPPSDDENEIDSDPLSPNQFTADPDGENHILVNGEYYPIKNRSAHHNFKPLSDLLNHPSWLAYDFFSGDYKVRQWSVINGSPINDLEAYYLQNGAPNELSTVAIGWVRNRNSSIFNSYYLTSAEQEFLSCGPPDPANNDAIYLTDFVPGTYHVSWFPTRWNSTIHPPDVEVNTVMSSTLLPLDLEGQFGSIANDYLDTLQGDYAFIVTPAPFAKSRKPEAVHVDSNMGWDFAVYPNPTREGITLQFEDDVPKTVTLLDLSGRAVLRQTGVTGSQLVFPELGLAQGAYWIRVTDGEHQRVKKVIIQ